MLTVVTTTAFLFLSSRQRRSLDQLLLKINNAFKAGAGAPNCDKGQGGGAEVINVVFPGKFCSSSPVLKALLTAVGRKKVLGAVLSLAPGAGAQIWLWPHPS